MKNLFNSIWSPNKILAPALLLGCSFTLSAQELFVNTDLFIAPATTVFAGDDVLISANAVVYNKGIIEAKAAVTNTGSYQVGPNADVTTSNEGLLLLSGSASQAIDFGSDTLFNIEINNANNITGGDLEIAGTATFTDGAWLLGAANVGFTQTGVVTGADAGKYFQTTGAGTVAKNYAATGNFDFPIGTAATFHPVALSPDVATRIALRVVEGILEDPTDNTSAALTDAVNATWILTSSAALTGSDLGLTYPQTAETGAFDRANAFLLVWEDVPATTAYDASATTNTGSDPYTNSTTTFAVNATNTYYIGLGEDLGGITIIAACFLEGPFNGTTMNAGLSAGGATSILATQALSQPYNAAPWNYAGDEAVTAAFFAGEDIVDWILVELRDATDPTVVLEQKAGFLKTNGDIITPDNAAFKFSQPRGNYHVAIRHRNHVEIRSENIIDFASGTASFDVRLSDSNVAGLPKLKQSGSSFLLYGGDGVNDRDITVDDLLLWLNDNGNVGLYLAGDFNLDGDVTVDDLLIFLSNNGIVFLF
ncbi:MAG: hypothetical protein LAT76_11380 [Schleiferiaceae bacterium]|nr:hypothetical protein [Schleiferiaceae bacterium]